MSEQLELSTATFEPDEDPPSWYNCGRDRWEYREGGPEGFLLGVVRRQAKTTYEWLTRFQHAHTDTLRRAQRFVQEENER